jgi:hypothetical protein
MQALEIIPYEKVVQVYCSLLHLKKRIIVDKYITLKVANYVLLFYYCNKYSVIKSIVDVLETHYHLRSACGFNSP